MAGLGQRLILGAIPLPWALGGSTVVYAIAPVALSLGSFGHPIAAVLLLRLLYGLALPPYDVNAATIRHVTMPDHLQGRAIAVINTLGWGALGLGPLVGGWLGQSVGLLTTILVGTTVRVFGAAPAFSFLLRRLHTQLLMREAGAPLAS